MTDPLADLSDEGLAGLWAIAQRLDQNPDGTVTDWANLGSLDDIGPEFDPADEVWAGIQRQAFQDLAPPRPLPWRNTARPSQIPPPGRWRHWLIMAGRGWGKALDLRTMIPTPTGFRKLGELNVGDQVFDESGRPCKIADIYEPTPRKAYRLTFSDGTTLDACDEHQWVTWTHADRKAYLRSPYEPDTSRFPDEWPAWRLARKHRHWPEPRRDPDGPGPRIRTTQEIVDTLTYGKRGDLNHAIPTAGPLQLPAADLPVDPWLLGYWLGDGHSASARITVAEADLPHVLGRLRTLGLTPKVFRRADRAPSVALYGGLIGKLRDLGVLGDKHVPEFYLWGSIEQREALLHGLMDSDGYAESSKVEFVSTSQALADAVVQLARSLGQKPVLAEGRATLNGRDLGPKLRVTWRPTRQPFSLARKAAKIDVSGGPQGLRNHHRMIVAAEEIPPVPMRCLTVDGPHHMYLAGESMTPTHNTFVGAGWLAERALADPGDYAIVAPTLGDAKLICVEGPSGLLRALGGEDGPHVEQYNRSEYTLYLKNGSRIRLGSADAPARIRGWNFKGVWCDEVGSWKDLTVWNEGIKFATRIGDPRIIITTTPTRGNKILVKLLDQHKDAGGAISGGLAANTFLTRGGTRENRANLSADWLAEIEEEFAGTTLGRQELDGELLRAVPGALITIDIIEATRLTAERTPDPWRVVCGVDPAVTNTEDSDECGIIVAGLGPAPADWVQPPGTPPALPNAPHLYLFEDYSRRVTPYAWARQALEGADDWAADAITAETNNGGDLVHTMVQLVAEQSRLRVPRLTKNTTAVGKRARAEPMAGMWEQHRVHIVGTLKHVEDQWASWVPGSGKDSPDRLDASVWAGVELLPHLGAKPSGRVKLIA